MRKQTLFDPGRREDISYFCCILWVVMPLIVLFGALYYGLLSADSGSDWVFIDTLEVFSMSFYVIGTLALVFSLTVIFQSSGTLFSRESIKKEPWLYLLFAVLLCSVLSTLFSGDRVTSFLGSYTCNDGLLSYFIYGGLLVCALQLKSDDKKLRIITIFTAVISILSVSMLLENAGVEWAKKCLISERASVFFQFNHFAYILCMSILMLVGLFLYQPKTSFRIYSALSILLQTYTLIVNDTFGAYLAVCIALLFIYIVYFVSGRRFSVAVLVPVCAFILVTVLMKADFTPGNTSSTVASNFTELTEDVEKIVTQSDTAGNAGHGRWRLWKTGVDFLSGHWLFGYGPEGLLHTEYGTITAGAGTRPHNEYLQMADFNGVPALLAYVAAFVFLLIKQWKQLKQLKPSALIAAGAVFGYLVSAFVGITMFNTFSYFCLFLGFAAASEDWDSVFAPQKKSFSDGKMKPGKIVTVCTACALLIATIVTVSATREEAEREKSDLMKLWSAEENTKVQLQNGLLGEGDFWFEPVTCSFIPVEAGELEGYGEGTLTRGRTVYDFLRKHYMSCQYDESVSYAGKAILVSIREDGDRILCKCRWK